MAPGSSAADIGNDTPLHKACERNSTLKVVKLLVEHGASLAAVNNNGETPLDVAINYDKKRIAAYLRTEERGDRLPCPLTSLPPTPSHHQ